MIKRDQNFYVKLKKKKDLIHLVVKFHLIAERDVNITSVHVMVYYWER